MTGAKVEIQVDAVGRGWTKVNGVIIPGVHHVTFDTKAHDLTRVVVHIFASELTVDALANVDLEIDRSSYRLLDVTEGTDHDEFTRDTTDQSDTGVVHETTILPKRTHITHE